MKPRILYLHKLNLVLISSLIVFIIDAVLRDKYVSLRQQWFIITQNLNLPVKSKISVMIFFIYSSNLSTSSDLGSVIFDGNFHCILLFDPLGLNKEEYIATTG